MTLKILGGFLKDRRLCDGYSTDVRPITSRMLRQLFDILRGARGEVLDLFAGTGIIGIEALSRGASHVTAIDINAQNCHAIKSFIAVNRLSDNFTIEKSNAQKVQLNGKKYDIVFIDPPYEKNMINKTLHNLCQQQALNPDGIIVIKSSKREIIACQDLQMLRTEMHGDSVLSFWCSA